MAAAAPKKLKTNQRDECWKCTIDVSGRSRNQTKCPFCRIINSGGINRLKYHIVGIHDHDTKPCKEESTEDKRFCYVALEKYEQAKQLRQKQSQELAQIDSRAPIYICICISI